MDCTKHCWIFLGDYDWLYMRGVCPCVFVWVLVAVYLYARLCVYLYVSVYKWVEVVVCA